MVTTFRGNLDKPYLDWSIQLSVTSVTNTDIVVPVNPPGSQVVTVIHPLLFYLSGNVLIAQYLQPLVPHRIQVRWKAFLSWQNTCSLGYTVLSHTGHRLDEPHFGPALLAISLWLFCSCLPGVFQDQCLFV